MVLDEVKGALARQSFGLGLVGEREVCVSAARRVTLHYTV